MEFRYRAGDKRSPQNSTAPPPPAAPVTAVYRPLLQGGIPMANNASDALLWREIEKERIRQEIIATEFAGIAWRRELEMEVRREMGFRLQRSFAGQPGFAFQEWPLLARSSLNPTEGAYRVVSQLEAPPVVALPETQASSQPRQDQVFVLDKKDLQVCGDKRKAEAADVSAPSGANKILKQGFSCALCQVSATSEESLHDHLRGKKHRKKEAALKIGLEVEKPSRQPSVMGEEAVKRCITEANMNPMIFDNGELESRTEVQCVQESHNIVALEWKAMEEPIASTHNQFNQETQERKIPMLKPGLIFPNIEPCPQAESKQL